MNIVSEQLCFGNIGTGASSREIFSIWQFPKTVRLQPPEGIFRMAALPGRTELSQKLLEVLVHIGIWNQPVLAP
jgi:hypothetical protein